MDRRCCIFSVYSEKRFFVVTVQDFGDGGAYPEIAVAQYPLGMGQKKSTSNALTLAVDKSGKLKFDSLAKQGHGKDKVFVCQTHD